MNTSTTKFDFTNTPLNHTIRKSVAFITFFAQVLALLLFIFGIVENFRKNINVISSINLIIKIFSIPKTAIYLFISNFFIGIFYIICLIFLVKNIINYFPAFLYLLKKEPLEHSFRLAADTLVSSFNACIRIIVIYCILTCAFGEYQLSSGGSWLLIILGLCYVAICFLRSYLDDYTFVACVHRTIYSALFFIVCAFTFKYLLGHSFLNMVNGFKALSTNVYQNLESALAFGAIYRTIISPILVFIVQMIFFAIIYFGLITYYVTDSIENAPIKPFLYFSIAIVIVGVIVKLIASNSSIDNISTCRKYAKENLPLLLYSISFLMIYKFEDVTNKKQSTSKADSNENIEQLNNNENQ